MFTRAIQHSGIELSPFPILNPITQVEKEQCSNFCLNSVETIKVQCVHIIISK
jgi:hypothetical protein